MSDTVKFIIEIDKRAYEGCQQLRTNDDDGIVGFCAINTIANGIPLDDVKAEMEELAEQYKEYRYANTYISLCIKILDNIGKAESEEKH